jgi:hypothetical protein
MLIILKENKEFDRIFENIFSSFFLSPPTLTEMKSSKKNYSSKMCQIDQGTMVLVMAHRKKINRYDKVHNIHVKLMSHPGKEVFSQAVCDNLPLR